MGVVVRSGGSGKAEDKMLQIKTVNRQKQNNTLPGDNTA
jgi:hypothetical protein